MTPEQEAELCAGLLRIADRCAEALATLHGDNEVDQQHIENVLDINREVWSLRWELGLPGGHERLSPSPFEGPVKAEDAS
jgi:hypothetical protein